jgi:hypothetical protein
LNSRIGEKLDGKVRLGDIIQILHQKFQGLTIIVKAQCWPPLLLLVFDPQETLAIQEALLLCIVVAGRWHGCWNEEHGNVVMCAIEIVSRILDQSVNEI